MLIQQLTQHADEIAKVAGVCDLFCVDVEKRSAFRWWSDIKDATVKIYQLTLCDPSSKSCSKMDNPYNEPYSGEYLNYLGYSFNNSYGAELHSGLYLIKVNTRGGTEIFKTVFVEATHKQITTIRIGK